MNTPKNIIKNTIIFIVIFILASLGFFIALGLVLDQANIEDAIGVYVPLAEEVDDRALDWEEIGKMDGVGLVVDGNQIIRSYNQERSGEISADQMLEMLAVKDQAYQSMLYDTTDGNKLFLSYPSARVNRVISFELTGSQSRLKTPMIFLILAILIIYLSIIYLIVLWLAKKINKEIGELYLAQEKERDLLFKGIAHDVKTPLAVILSYSKALNDQLIEDEAREKYLTTIEKNALILNDRVDDLLDFASFDKEAVKKEEKDILEIIRRYVGHNYMYFMDQGAAIDILYGEDESYLTLVDEKLFTRILQNILQNAIDHNEGAVGICIDFKDKKLIFKDTGKGISREDADKIFNPLYTADASRSGDKLRGMGLSNVKRICDIHGWDISYDEGFIIGI